MRHFSTMLTIASKGKEARRRGRQLTFVGLSADARLLRVSPSHLWRVRHGLRVSAKLSAADAALQAQRPRQPTRIDPASMTVQPASNGAQVYLLGQASGQAVGGHQQRETANAT